MLPIEAVGCNNNNNNNNNNKIHLYSAVNTNYADNTLQDLHYYSYDTKTKFSSFITHSK